MAFNKDLMPKSDGSLFSHEKGSCTWTELFTLRNVVAKSRGVGRVEVVRAKVEFEGDRVGVSAYKKHLDDEDTLLVVNADRDDLVGAFCHLADGNRRLKVLRYFYGGVYFEERNSSALIANLAELGYAAPIVPGVAVEIIVKMLTKNLDIEVGKSFRKNVDGMTEWMTNNYRSYTYSPWPISG